MLDIASTDLSQRNAMVEGKKAALVAVLQIRERIGQLQAERARASQPAVPKMAKTRHQVWLDNRFRMKKLAGMTGLDGTCAAPWQGNAAVGDPLCLLQQT